jgi:hypothetical protein
MPASIEATCGLNFELFFNKMAVETLPYATARVAVAK